VRVERHDQLRGADRRPHAKIEGIAPHHPAQEQIQPLAGAPRRRSRKEEGHTRPAWHTPVDRSQVEFHRSSREPVERRTHIFGGRIFAFGEEPFDRSPAIEHLVHQPHQGHDVFGSRPAMTDAGKRATIARRLESAHVFGRTIAKDGHESLDRLEHARDAAERQRRRAERHDFEIFGPPVSPNDLNRVGGRVRRVEAVVETIEAWLECVCGGFQGWVPL